MKDRISNFPMIFHNGGYIMFGGYTSSTVGKGKATSTIARLDEISREWSKLGELVKSRFSGP